MNSPELFNTYYKPICVLCDKYHPGMKHYQCGICCRIYGGNCIADHRDTLKIPFSHNGQFYCGDPSTDCLCDEDDIADMVENNSDEVCFYIQYDCCPHRYDFLCQADFDDAICQHCFRFTTCDDCRLSPNHYVADRTTDSAVMVENEGWEYCEKCRAEWKEERRNKHWLYDSNKPSW